jgi:hypothetical protein
MNDELEEKIQSLAKTFPCLSDVPYIDPWGPSALDHWAVNHATKEQNHAVRFLLAVFVPGKPKAWRCGGFDVVDAFRVWDDCEKEAFLTWARNPWWY